MYSLELGPLMRKLCDRLENEILNQTSGVSVRNAKVKDMIRENAAEQTEKVASCTSYCTFEYLACHISQTRISCKYIGVLPRENRVYRDHRVYTNACIHISEMKPATVSAALNPTVATYTRSRDYVIEDLLI
uniref:Uncharacterized protein n=1 Tax=Trichogramma kaykai TaxID=54128 RepID=A0ABD2X458_9HYME